MLSLDDVVQNNEAVADRIVDKTLGYVVIDNHREMAVHTTVENTMTQGIVKQITRPLVYTARSAVRDLDVTNDLRILRVATKKYELLIAPESEFTIVVLQ